MTMRVLVTGAGGMLGRDVVERLRRDADVVGLTRDQLDITDPARVSEAVADVDAIVNCAAYTAVDAAQDQEATAFAINAVGPQLLARAASERGARLVQVSTDYVFAGDARSPYAETDPLAPVSAYGRTKAAGEWAVRAAGAEHLVVRTAWLYGAGGACFPRTIARLVRERGGLDVVADQWGQPTWTVDVAEVIAGLLAVEAPGGVYHTTSTGSCTWHAFARAVVAADGGDPDVVAPTTSEAFQRPAPRPSYSVLGHQRLHDAGVAPIGPWEERWTDAARSVLGTGADPRA